MVKPSIKNLQCWTSFLEEIIEKWGQTRFLPVMQNSSKLCDEKMSAVSFLQAEPYQRV
jgi:hypothetical protein